MSVLIGCYYPFTGAVDGTFFTGAVDGTFFTGVSGVTFCRADAVESADLGWQATEKAMIPPNKSSFLLREKFFMIYPALLSLLINGRSINYDSHLLLFCSIININYFINVCW